MIGVNRIDLMALMDLTNLYRSAKTGQILKNQRLKKAAQNGSLYQ